MIGIVAVITYLSALHTETSRKRLIWTVASGFTVFLGGLSWEGFGVFISILLIVELYRFLSSETEERLGFYALWVCCFVPTLYLASPAYRNGYGFAEHLFTFVLVPPVVLLILRTFRHLLLTKTRWANTLKTHGRVLSLGLTLAGITFAIGYAFTQMNSFASTTVPLSQNRLMQNIGELKNPLLEHYMIRYGSVFALGCLGLVMAVIRFWKRAGLLLTVSFLLFTLTVFYRSRMDGLWGTATGNLFFGISIAACAIGILVLSLCGQRTHEKGAVSIAFIVWFIVWVSLTRDARRYDFFISIAVAFFTADLLCYLTDFYANHVKRYQPWLLKTAIITGLLVPILFWQPVGGHATLARKAAMYMRRPLPGNSSLTEALDWIKAHLPPTAVTAGCWNYGSLLNTLGGVKTIIDQDHYIQHWIHLYNRHVFCANSHSEALGYLKTHEATHLMLDAQDTIFNAAYYSNLGSVENGDIRFTITPLQPQPPKDMKYRAAPGNHANIPLESVDFDMTENTLTVKAQLKTGDTVNLPAVALINKRRVTAEGPNKQGGVLIIFDEDQ